MRWLRSGDFPTYVQNSKSFILFYSFVLPKCLPINFLYFTEQKMDND